MIDRKTPSCVDESVRDELRDTARRLRAVAERCRPLEVMCHDLARIIETIALLPPASLDGLVVRCFDPSRNSVLGEEQNLPWARETLGEKGD